MLFGFGERIALCAVLRDILLVNVEGEFRVAHDNACNGCVQRAYQRLVRGGGHKVAVLGGYLACYKLISPDTVAVLSNSVYLAGFEVVFHLRLGIVSDELRLADVSADERSVYEILAVVFL